VVAEAEDHGARGGHLTGGLSARVGEGEGIGDGHPPVDDDLATETVHGDAGIHDDRVVVRHTNLQAAHHAEAERKPVEEAAAFDEVGLLELEVRSV
jgi:hypothetical protein